MKKELGRQILYNYAFPDNTVIHWDVLKVQYGQVLCLEFISVNSKYRQGVRLAIDAGDGYIEINDKRSKEIYLWEDTCQGQVYIKCFSTEGLISVYNVFDLGKERGGIRAQTDSCGMLIECINGKKVYRCNDAGFATEFDKLVFQIECDAQ